MNDLKKTNKNIKVLIDNGYTPPHSKTLVSIFEDLVNVNKNQEERLINLEDTVQYLQREIDLMKSCF
jgi:uncharacterized protein YqkB